MEGYEFTEAGIIISIAFALAWFLGPTLPLRLTYRDLLPNWWEAAKLSLYAGILSFLITRVIPPMDLVWTAISYTAGLLAYALGVRLRLQLSWPESFRGAVVAWGTVILPAIVIGYQLMTEYGVKPTG